MPSFSFTVNGRRRTVQADADTPLLWILRDTLGLRGTKYGCGVGICGACTVLEGKESVRSCQTTVTEAAGKTFTTIEGLSADGNHPCQRAWIDEDVSQCGYCQAGFIMETCALLARKPHPNDADIDQALDGHVCRCGTYSRMRRAVHRAAKTT
ncbi:MAG TPA: (2Fe-2S)-binding protein [Thermoanaerobaculia bacterium]|jgi:aerobic-type carbon monoxide dehydrogenase small subunit (CoxS/CutS family)